MSTTSQARAVRSILVGAGIVCVGLSSLGCRSIVEAVFGRVYPVSQAATHSRPRYGSYAGTLPNTPEAMGAADFLDFVRARDWSGLARTRSCRGVLCFLGLQQTEASAEAIEDANTVDINALATSRYGVLVARLENRGKHTEYTYGIPPGNDEWYFLWSADTSGKPRARLVKLSFSPTGAPSLESEKTDRLVYACTPAHSHPKLAKAVADLTGCKSRIPVEWNALRFSVIALATSAWKADAWISCSQGCCTSDYP
jgi:hypothetical protein